MSEGNTKGTKRKSPSSDCAFEMPVTVTKRTTPPSDLVRRNGPWGITAVIPCRPGFCSIQGCPCVQLPDFWGVEIPVEDYDMSLCSGLEVVVDSKLTIKATFTNPNPRFIQIVRSDLHRFFFLEGVTTMHTQVHKNNADYWTFQCTARFESLTLKAKSGEANDIRFGFDDKYWEAFASVFAKIFRDLLDISLNGVTGLNRGLLLVIAEYCYM